MFAGALRSEPMTIAGFSESIAVHTSALLAEAPSGPQKLGAGEDGVGATEAHPPTSLLIMDAETHPHSTIFNHIAPMQPLTNPAPRQAQQLLSDEEKFIKFKAKMTVMFLESVGQFYPAPMKNKRTK